MFVLGANSSKVSIHSIIIIRCLASWQVAELGVRHFYDEIVRDGVSWIFARKISCKPCTGTASHRYEVALVVVLLRVSIK